MTFGICCFINKDEWKNMNATSIRIEGVQRSLLVNFEVIQSFMHSEPTPQEIHYIFPNDLKICIYDTTFVIGEEIIKPKIKSKEEAKEEYQEAVKAGYSAIHGANISNGLTSIKLGNLSPGVECKVIIKMAFNSELIKSNQFFIKFPLDSYTPLGSVESLKSSEFSFFLHLDDTIKNVTSNVINGIFDRDACMFSINNEVKSHDNQNSIIINFESVKNVENTALISSSDESSAYEGCALVISPNIPPITKKASEFVFVIDCSGSMSGISISKARECLIIFIKSIPINSYFNVYKFGSSFQKLFEKSNIYNDETSEIALKFANNLNADLGGTYLFEPLQDIYSNQSDKGQRQIFIMTDGEVSNTEEVLELVSSNSKDNRCFTLGIGRGCDSGLVEGIANSSNGKCDFVQEGDSISEKVIPQLESSLQASIESVEVHIEGDDSFEVSPFPIPAIASDSAKVLYLRERKRPDSFEGGICVSGFHGEDNIEMQIENVIRLELFDEDQFGCSGGKNIGKAILSLFAYSLLQRFEIIKDISKEEEAKVIELSVSSGVLCKYTGFVGMIQNSFWLQKRGGRTKLNARRSTGGCTPRKSLGALGARKSTLAVVDNQFSLCKPTKSLGSTDKLAMDVDEIPDKYNWISLTKFQKASGNWNNLNAVKKITGINIDHIDEVNTNDENIKNSIVATILAIAAMRVKSSNDKKSWAMIEKKAIIWLQQNLPGVNIEMIISRIESLIPK